VRGVGQGALAEALPPPRRPLLQSVYPRQRADSEELTGPSGGRYTLLTRMAWAERAGGPISVHLILFSEDFAGALFDRFFVAPASVPAP
jgi:hypothetical protein